MYEELFYQRLIKLRTQKGVSARDMSLSIGQSAGYINALENRNGFPSMQIFFYICEYLDVTPAELYVYLFSCPAEYREIVEDLKSLTLDRVLAYQSNRQRAEPQPVTLPVPLRTIENQQIHP